MKKAILHLGFHKTGTTFLQLATRRWVEAISADEPPVFFSSQHAPGSGWLELRTAHIMRLRQRVAHADLGALPDSRDAVWEQLSGLGLTEELNALRRFFARHEPILVHSDENSIGGNPGHAGYKRGRPWPFYPNGDWLCAAFSAAALANYDEIHLVLTLRRFDEMVLSSLKNAIRSPRPLPPLHLFASAVSDLGKRCRMLVGRVSKLEFVRNIHIFDYDLLRTSPAKYVKTFLELSGRNYCAVPASPGRIINASAETSAALDRLVERGVLSREKRSQIDDIAALIDHETITVLAHDYEMFRMDMANATPGSGKVRYYS